MAARVNSKSKQISDNRIPPLQLVLAFIVALACFVFLPTANANPRLEWSLVSAAGALFVFWLFLRRQVVRAGHQLHYDFLVRPVHHVQLTMHSCIYAYWGWYWREVYHQIPLIIAQIVFVYALDMLVCWSRRDEWILGENGAPIKVAVPAACTSIERNREDLLEHPGFNPLRCEFPEF